MPDFVVEGSSDPREIMFSRMRGEGMVASVGLVSTPTTSAHDHNLRAPAVQNVIDW